MRGWGSGAILKAIGIETFERIFSHVERSLQIPCNPLNSSGGEVELCWLLRCCCVCITTSVHRGVLEVLNCLRITVPISLSGDAGGWCGV